jgi:uncharacterized protein YjeT (DUF2065 family)
MPSLSILGIANQEKAISLSILVESVVKFRAGSMWDEVLTAVALLLVFEGMMPFLNPSRWRNVIRIVSAQPDSALRLMGLFSMLMGAAMLYFVH